MKIKPINLGLIELHPFPKKYKDRYGIQLMKDLEGSDLKLAYYKEKKYILSLDKDFSLCLEKNYSESFITSIVVTYDNGEGRYYDIIIDDPEELERFLDGDGVCYGYSEENGEHEVNRNSGYMVDWKAEKTIVFLVKNKI